MPTERPERILIGSTIVALCLAWHTAAAAESLAAPDAVPPAESEPAAPDASDLDSLLEMADKNVEGLGKVNVGTVTDPVVEGVSKKAEQLSEAPGIVDVITAEDIEQFGAKNLYEVLERATSVYMTGSFLFPRNVASIRGNLIKHEDNHVLLLINNRPFRDVTAGGINVALFTAFPIQTIERIEVIRGPGSVLYGTNAFTGVINIVTKDPDKPTWHASVLSGSYGWQSYSLAAGNGNDWDGNFTGATYSRSDGWPFTATEDVVAPAPLDTDTAPWGENNFGLFSMYRKGNFTANVFVAHAQEQMLGPDGAWPADTLTDPRVFCNFGHRLELDDCQSIESNFTYNWDGTYFPSVLAIPGGPDNNFKIRSHSFLLEETYYATLTDELDLMIGGYVDFHMGRAFIEPLSIPSIPDYTEIWYGVYMQAEYEVTEWLKLVGGMQANLPGEIEGGIVPRAGVIGKLNDHWTTKFLYGQAFRSPYQIERSISVPGILFGNPDLAPETIQTFDAQLEYHTDDFRLAATWFHSDFFGVVTRVGFPQTYENQGRIKFDGVELESDWELSQRWRWLGSLTYQDNVRDGVHNTTGVPNWMAKTGIAYHDSPRGWTVGLWDTYFSRPHPPAGAVDLNVDPDPIHLVSLNMLLDLNRRCQLRRCHTMQLQFLIQNLLDESIHHVEFERELVNTFPAGPGQTFYGGLRMQY